VYVSEDYLSWAYDESFADDGIAIAKPVVIKYCRGMLLYSPSLHG